MDWELSPHQTYPAPDIKGRKAILSFHRKWLGTISADGQLELRLMKMLVSSERRSGVFRVSTQCVLQIVLSEVTVTERPVGLGV